AATKQVKQLKKQNEEQKRSNIRSLTLDQYVKAVDQLGRDDSMAVRLGGIYSLEKIMNSPDEEVKDYHDTIIELLCAYVREKRPFDTNKYKKDLELFEKEYSDLPNERYYSEYEKFIESLIKYKITVDTDIRAILTVFGRRENSENEKVVIDLTNTNWIEANLDLISLKGFNLSESHLENAELMGAHLEDTNFMEAHLENTNLGYTNLKNTTLRYANLEHAYLKGAHLENADLYYANFKNIKLVPPMEDREETKEEIIEFIKELAKAGEIKGIELDDKIKKIIEEEFPDLFIRISNDN
ncbi:MAG: pentapeptide repeat-containing protein, partial [Promethearchaeota archaeon]